MRCSDALVLWCPTIRYPFTRAAVRPQRREAKRGAIWPVYEVGFSSPHLPLRIDQRMRDAVAIRDRSFYDRAEAGQRADMENMVRGEKQNGMGRRVLVRPRDRLYAIYAAQHSVPRSILQLHGSTGRMHRPSTPGSQPRLPHGFLNLDQQSWTPLSSLDRALSIMKPKACHDSGTTIETAKENNMVRSTTAIEAGVRRLRVSHGGKSSKNPSSPSMAGGLSGLITSLYKQLPNVHMFAYSR